MTHFDRAEIEAAWRQRMALQEWTAAQPR